jgi:hypothetical protein
MVATGLEWLEEGVFMDWEFKRRVGRSLKMFEDVRQDTTKTDERDR